jgi:hypothetical protein
MDRIAKEHHPRCPQSNGTEHDQHEEADGCQDVMDLSAQQAQTQENDKMNYKNNEYGEQQRLGHRPSYAGPGANVKFQMQCQRINHFS